MLYPLSYGGPGLRPLKAPPATRAPHYAITPLSPGWPATAGSWRHLRESAD